MPESISLAQTTHGVLNLCKSYGSTSMDAIRILKKLTNAKRIGHAGTLDPIATGVLPVCFGQATKLMEFLINSTKRYRGVIMLGVTTDTYDSQGREVSRGNWENITESQVEAVLSSFIGSILQVPPMYSALKHDGQRLYSLARAGEDVYRPPRPVHVYGVKLLNWEPPLITIEVECGRGFYMRSFAYDVGESLGCGAHLSALVRTRTGSLSEDSSITLDNFAELVNAGDWQASLIAPDGVLGNMAAVSISSAAERFIRTGQEVSIPGTEIETRHLEMRRAYNGRREFVGILRFNRTRNLWKSERIFNLPVPSSYAPE